jgi:hypothetical protein
MPIPELAPASGAPSIGPALPQAAVIPIISAIASPVRIVLAFMPALIGTPCAELRPLGNCSERLCSRGD